MNIETALKEAMTLDGAIGVALVDYESAMSLGALGGGQHLDLELAAAGNTEVVRSKMRTLASIQTGTTEPAAQSTPSSTCAFSGLFNPSPPAVSLGFAKGN